MKLPKMGWVFLVTFVACLSRAETALRFPDESGYAAFHLCASHVAAISITGDTGITGLHVQLNEDATRKFSHLTAAYSGRTVVILAGERIVSRAVVHAPIASGLITLRAESVEEAGRIRQAIMKQETGKHCGSSPATKPS